MNISERVALVNKCMEEIRNHINTPCEQSILLENKIHWNQICSSLDVMEDSLCSVDSYFSNKYEYPEDIGLKYIYLYGLMQSLFLMQDAFQNLHEAFLIDYKATETLKEIRNLRNSSIGHPTKQDRNKDGKTYYSYINRESISREGFQLMRDTGLEESDYENKHVNILQICSDQLDEINKACLKLIEKIKKIN